MKKTVFLISICIAILFTSCKKDLDKVCHVSDPLTELPWLAEYKDFIDAGYLSTEISKVILRDKKTGRRISAISTYGLYPDAGGVYISCSGESLCFWGGFTGKLCEDYEVIKEEVIYTYYAPPIPTPE